MTERSYQQANAGKADFEWTYNRLDPRSYFQVLGALDYAIPERAAPIFLKTFDAYATARRRDALTVLDLGCSYGINAAVLKYGRTMEELREHYNSLDEQEIAPRDVLRADQTDFFDGNPKRDIAIVGIDRAQFASSYGFWAGLLDDAIPEDFELNDPTPQAASTIARCDLVISTGVVGYVTERTFTRILRCQPENEMPWVASFVLRMFDYGPVAATLEQFGYVTEKLAGRYFRQRRFADDAERKHVERLLEKRNLCTSGLEANGHYLAEFYLSRPACDMKAAPLTSFLR
ncbi:MAG: hypothetical protein KGJ79_02240 [Alphaproteobacteria bacterium]|nr:hypothetical protein [Alphaproteobacteria bacterium]MDE2109933.1 hypothetical protein [Alphaproteobacteria bacterium]MDE2496086.1 hypothetical protein [Alphaproteobacteria bacterium]